MVIGIITFLGVLVGLYMGFGFGGTSSGFWQDFIWFLAGLHLVFGGTSSGFWRDLIWFLAGLHLVFGGSLKVMLGCIFVCFLVIMTGTPESVGKYYD